MHMKTVRELAAPRHLAGSERMYRFLDSGSTTIAARILENCWSLRRFAEICFPGELRS